LVGLKLVKNVKMLNNRNQQRLVFKAKKYPKMIDKYIDTYLGLDPPFVP
jgi:hypothetical protein